MNKKLLLKLTGIIFCLFTFSQLYAQIPLAPPNIQSPNVASLGLFGEVPVSHFTGVPEINIPLYTLTERAISIPISLSYHASGFRPDQHPGWVGMGWALQAGGVISREVKDRPDEYDYDYFKINLGPNTGKMIDDNKGASGFDVRDMHYGLNTPSWNTIPYMTNNIMLNNAWINDLEPDVFNFNFPGYSGQFFMDPLGNWQVKCDKPLKISNLPDEYINVPFHLPIPLETMGIQPYRSYRGFMVTTEDGTQYIFGNTTDAIEYSIPFFYQAYNQFTANSWYLTQIIAPSGQQATFTYERGDFVNQMGIFASMEINSYSQTSSGSLQLRGCHTGSTQWGPVVSFADGSLIAPVYLKTIQIGNKIASFNRSTTTELRYDNSIYSYKLGLWNASNSAYPQFGNTFLPYLQPNNEPVTDAYNKLQWSKLDFISVSTGSQNIAEFDFNYNNVATERLKLSSVTGKDVNSGATNGTYIFGYDNSKPLPNYLAAETDHWGFYNGTVADMSYNGFWTNYYQYREPNAAYLYTGTLNKITYPTGGATEFTYEPNYYGSCVGLNRSATPQLVNPNALCGGLRIRKITTYGDQTNPANNMTKEYFYVKNYSPTVDPSTLPSSGVLNSQIQYYFIGYTIPGFSGGGAFEAKDIFSSQSILPQTTNSMGSHIGYTEVVEKRSDGAHTRYSYSNFDNGYADEPADNTLHSTLTYYQPCNSREDDRGRPLSETIYNVNNQLVKSKVTSYTALNKSSQYVRSLKTTAYSLCNTPGNLAYECTAYKTYTYSFLPQTVTEIVFDPTGNNGVTTTTNYTYTDSRQIKTILTSNSKNETKKIAYRYPFDVLIPATDGTSSTVGPYSVMINENILSPVETIQSTIKGGIETFTSSTLTKYGVVNTVHPGIPNGTPSPLPYSGIFPFTQLKSEMATPASSYIPYTAAVSNSIESESTIDPSLKPVTNYSWDTNGNLVQEENVNNPGGGRFTSYLWGYNGNYPVAKITESNYATVSGFVNNTVLQNPATTDANMRTELNKIRTGLAGSVAQVFTYTYDSMLGMTSSTDPKGETTYYEYDAFQRLMNIKDQNGKIVKSYQYHFPPPVTVYSSVVKSGTYTKNNCPSGQTGSTVTYTVPAGTYTSTISQADADGKATADVTANGQTYANTHGSCTAPMAEIIYATNTYPDPSWTIVGTIVNKITGQPYPLFSGLTPPYSTLDIPTGQYRLDISWSNPWPVYENYMISINGAQYPIDKSTNYNYSWDIDLNSSYSSAQPYVIVLSHY